MNNLENDIEKPQESDFSSLENLITNENLKDVLSTMNIWVVYSWWNPDKILVAIAGVMENHGFGCTERLEKELFFKNESHNVHIVLLDKEEEEKNKKELSIDMEELMSAYEDLLGNVPIVIEPLEITFTQKSRNKRPNYNTKTSRINTTNGYKNQKYTKSARSPKNSGRNFRKQTKKW